MRAAKKRIGPPSGPRQLNIAETRDKILRAAIVQFAKNGFSGARIESICKDADVNARMVYHYYVDKAGLYVAVLEHVLGELRTEELKLDVSAAEPIDGLLTMFDFIFGHFAKHPELIRLLSAENLLEGSYLKTSMATPAVASPVVEHIDTLLRRGEEQGAVRVGIDALHLYVVMVALSYFHKSNAYTLATIWNDALLTRDWQNDHRAFARSMLATFLAPVPASQTACP
ncbi:TetR family transcriptional regulator [Devosia sp. XJ19-1]|uniref:TetR family transcriptional regulator n=1 Tax=Devosia ureilytica TaxID=2952754 RepID=A0A9Q4FQF0_9HYPH|nr:TetR family transcriptional regulator [Devosia ureilytica]MCP8882148.1 TetR family transcriptional regulator [Devosia ureilytica]MCP8885966.1 TetR family transcriptional regulator [Devosia ureilytica]